MKHLIGKGLKGSLALVLITLLSTPVWAAQPNRPARARVGQARVVSPARARVLLPGGGQVNRLILQIRTLNLTPEQTRALRQMVRRARPRGQKIQQAIQRARKALTQAVNRGKNRQALRRPAQALTKAFIDQAVFQHRVRNALIKQLTEEQRRTLRQRAQRLAHKQNRGGPQQRVRQKQSRQN